MDTHHVITILTSSDMATVSAYLTVTGASLVEVEIGLFLLIKAFLYPFDQHITEQRFYLQHTRKIDGRDHRDERLLKLFGDKLTKIIVTIKLVIDRSKSKHRDFVEILEFPEHIFTDTLTSDSFLVHCPLDL